MGKASGLRFISKPSLFFFTMNKKTQIAALRKRCGKLLGEGKLKVMDLQDIDFDAEVDSKLTYQENKAALEGRYVVKDVKEEDYQEAEFEYVKEEEARCDEEFKKSVGRLKGGEQEEYFKELRDFVAMVAKGFSHSLIVEGRGGIGKTYEVLKRLNELGVDYEYISSYSTPLEFYQLLWEHNGKVIVLDDFEGVLENDVGISILKAALWNTTDKRFVSYYTTSNRLRKDVPRKFEFTGGIIFCLNTLMSNPEIASFKTRAFHYDLEFSVEDVQKIIMAIAKSVREEGMNVREREEVGQFVVDCSDSATEDLNIRTLKKAYAIYKYCRDEGLDWKQMAMRLVKPDDEKLLVKELTDKHMGDVAGAAKEFTEKTGKSRRTFFLLKKKMNLSRGWSKR
jgi:hypothetical protein